eukprot:TRINITY_DN5163_c0_g1_i2.p1 TRINITY_DN5163_c0_g1~~TRINITY_DN5163_c0_g1_i2.p1  ORF type:complete len:167 (+),score=39.44 TRINITY_DN5163_c0_g1_i2:75-575(+)
MGVQHLPLQEFDGETFPSPSSSEEAAQLLHDGARYGDEDDVRAALQFGVDINCTRSGNRSTALHLAAANGHSHIICLLLSQGTAVNARNAEGNTPLHWAALNAHSSAVELLMGAGADPSALNRHERTPVDEALSGNHMEIVEMINTAMAAREGISSSGTGQGQQQA